MYDPELIIDALIATLDPEVRRLDPDGLRWYVDVVLLRHSERRPYLWADFLAERPDLVRPVPLVYDRPSRLVFVGGHAEHERIAGELYQFRLITADRPPLWRDLRHGRYGCPDFGPAADKFIETGMGFLMGSPTAQRGERRLNLGATVRFSVAERKVFSMYQVNRTTKPDQSERGERDARPRG